MNRRRFVKTGLSLVAATLGLAGAEASDFAFDPTTDIIKAPDDPAQWAQFREQLAAWREKRRGELAYSDALYRRPDFAWVPQNYACYFLMLNDERFYDAAKGTYRVKEWLDTVRRELGGCDSVVLWHAYPRIGLDARNQYDFYRDQPGGLPGLRTVVETLRRAGVRTYINYNPWDIHTRREAKPDVDMLCEIVAALGVDGVFLDTMKQGASDFRTKLDAIRPGIVLEGEVSLPMERVADHHMEWAQGFKDSETPGIVRNKWFERRHQLHHVQRWGHDRTAFFQAAFMNGTGTMLWDNVFGSWVGYSPREKSVLRAMLPIQRRFTALFSGERWTPLVPTGTATVYASLWEGDGIRLWTLVNRSSDGAAVTLPGITLRPGERLFDAVSGAEVKTASTVLRPRGIGCFVAARPNALGKGFAAFLKHQRDTDRIASTDATFPAEVRTTLKPVTPTKIYAHDGLPQGMVAIAGGTHPLRVRFRIRECGWYESDPNTIERFGSHLHEFRDLKTDAPLTPYAIDTTPVTNAAFAAFLKASGYKPKDTTNFLKHWQNGAPPADHADHPVVYVDLADARAYAKWAGKRLPTEAEWQFAAQGSDGRKYPWGDTDPKTQADLCNNAGNGTTPVKQFPAGQSPFGVYDLCGNTWEWTESERSDGINRFAMLRGGSFYTARQGDWSWYMDGGVQEAAFSCKYLLQYPGLDRSATVGFRCVADVQPSPLPAPVSVLLSPDANTLKYTGPGDAATILRIVPVTGQAFEQALHVNTLNVVKPATKDFYGLSAPIIAPAKKGDVLWISFRARTIEARRESGEAYFQLRLDQIVDGKYKWPPYIEPGIFIGREWTRISIPYVMERDVTPDTMRLVMNFDKYPQRFEIGPVTFVNYGSAIKITDLPRSVAKYGGSEPDAAWRKAATERIEQHRKGDLSVQVVDGAGKAVAGAQVSVRMKRLDFLIGSATDTHNLLDRSDTPKFREIFSRYFNHLVFDNEMKWPRWAEKSHNPELMFRVLDWAKEQNMTVRATPIIWPSWGHLPAYLKALQDDKAALRRETFAHIAEQTRVMKGRFIQWDTTNELYANHDLVDILGRDEIVAWYKAAHDGDPDVQLVYNEYTMFHEAGAGVEHFYDTVRFLKDKGAPVQGIGEQAHVGGSPPAIPLVLARLDRFAGFGLPITITEFDIGSNDEDLQARYMRDFMTAVFSHPATVGLVQWGFWEGAHYMPNAALWNKDWTIRKHGQVFVDIVTKEWRTDADGRTGAKGERARRATTRPALFTAITR